ncbi:MAG: hypothetical protein U0Y68_15785 [Blastocatellia bacterium]
MKESPVMLAMLTVGEQKAEATVLILAAGLRVEWFPVKVKDVTNDKAIYCAVKLTKGKMRFSRSPLTPPSLFNLRRH